MKIKNFDILKKNKYGGITNSFDRQCAVTPVQRKRRKIRQRNSHKEGTRPAIPIHVLVEDGKHNTFVLFQVQVVNLACG